VKGRKINWMKAAFLESDLNLTVSPNYAKELTEGPDKGVELDTIVRKAGVRGIVNGMDVQEWDPSADKYLDVPYDISTVCCMLNLGCSEIVAKTMNTLYHQFLSCTFDLPTLLLRLFGSSALIGRLIDPSGYHRYCPHVDIAVKNSCLVLYTFKSQLLNLSILFRI
jgi:hypothetical protein